VTAGFVDFEITWRKDVFSGAPQESSAANFGTVGINFRARKPIDQAEWVAQLVALNCDIPDASGREAVLPQESVARHFEADDFYDAGDLGCADGPLDEIARQMHSLTPGQTLEIRATDPSVASDLQAWCRLVGYQFVEQQGDRYLIRRQ
jgi:TusA-related sulfurtransferase